MNVFLLCVSVAAIILLINYIYCLFYSVCSYSDEELEKEAIENTVQYMNEHMEKYNCENTKLETDNYNEVCIEQSKINELHTDRNRLEQCVKYCDKKKFQCSFYTTIERL